MHLLRGLLDGNVETATLNGREYIVVPVVAMVEGVRHAVNAASPELVPVSAFGRVPASWNGRPVVVDHPSDSSGNAVSASSPAVLSSDYLGLIMNSRIDGSKLRVEAWIDTTGAASSDQVTKMLTRVANEEVIEVSVGAYVIVRAEKGTFEGEDYTAVWELCIPDHLAFLSTAEGACSIADGCGTFRTDAARTLAFSVNARSALAAFKEKNMTCKCDDHATATTEEPVVIEAVPATAEDAVATVQLASHEGLVERICLANGLHAADVRALLANAIGKWEGYHYLISFNDDYVVYEGYSGDGIYCFHKRNYTISTDNTVTFADDVVEVIPMTSFVEVPSATQLSAASGDNEQKGNSDVTVENVVTVARDASVEAALQAFEGTTFGTRVASAFAVEEGIRTDLVTKILAAPGNTMTEAGLKALSTDTLRGFVALAAAKTPEPAKVVETTTLAAQHGRSGGTGDTGSNKAPDAPQVFTPEYLEAHRNRRVG